MTIALVIAGLTFGAILVGAVVYVIRIVTKLSNQLHDADGAVLHTAEKLNQALLDLDTFQRNVATLEQAATGLKAQLLRETQARKLAEAQRDRFLTELAKGGDAKVVAAAINKELEAFR